VEARIMATRDRAYDLGEGRSENLDQDPATSDGAPNGGEDNRYTGVVIIHGIGDLKRNATLEEAVNTLAYWFNHQAGLALRRDGPGRVWVTAKLRDDPNPDAPAARATMRLAAPAAAPGVAGDTEAASVTSDDTGLRLEFREVWWAESVGLPSVAATFGWARVQAWEQASHLLLPIGRRIGPSHAASRAPAREISQAMTYRPAAAEQKTRRQTSARVGASVGDRPTLTRAQRVLLTGALGIYALGQYIWKAAQWLVLTPLILLLLLVMGLVRLLALLPPLRSTALASVSAFLDYIMLHWIAATQVYTQDYTRSAGIRERFEREVERLLRDERCDRLVVIAHSMGTVIAYEGLTTVLTRPEFRDHDQQVTFICLAQALRRAWLMTADDPHRLRGVLPERVRWLHFWARYDPVAAGPLSARSLPRLEAWPDPNTPDPHKALCARLEACENVDVVNTDSAFTDHTTYWQNFEQVVGPIARELVAGHPALEQAVEARLATADEIMLRRWRVAWRATVALIGGLVLGLALLLWDESQRWTLGHALATSFLQYLGNLLGAALGGFGTVLRDALNTLRALSARASPPVRIDVGFLSVIPPDITWSVVAALLVAGLGILLIGRGIALRSPLAFSSSAATTSARGLLALCAAYLALPAAALLIDAILSPLVPGYPQSASDDPAGILALLVIALLCGAVALVFAIVSAARRHQWGWETAIVVFAGPLALLVFIATPLGLIQSSSIVLFPGLAALFASSFGISYVDAMEVPGLAGAFVGVVGGLIALRILARRRRVGSFALVFLIEVGLLALVAVDNLIINRDFFTPIDEALGLMLPRLAPLLFPSAFVGLFMPVLAYALAYGSEARLVQRTTPTRIGGGMWLPVAVLALLNALAFVEAYLFEVWNRTDVDDYRLATFATAVGGAALATLIGLVAIGRVLVQVVRARRWGWLLALLLILLMVYFAAGGFDPLASSLHFPFGLHYVEDHGESWALSVRLFGLGLSLNVTALVYGLWGGVTLQQEERRGAPGRDDVVERGQSLETHAAS
jgi:hypothetical protein